MAVPAGVKAGHAAHLARRFVTSLRPGGPPPADEAWVASILSHGELGLWRAMSGADRRHTVAVARRVVHHLGSQAATRAVVAAALLHDVGKVVAGLGPWRRAAATLAGMRGARRLPTSFRRYLAHDRLGAQLLERVGSDPLTVDWARQHHWPPEAWTVPAATARALKSADDD